SSTRRFQKRVELPKGSEAIQLTSAMRQNQKSVLRPIHSIALSKRAARKSREESLVACSRRFASPVPQTVSRLSDKKTARNGNAWSLFVATPPSRRHRGEHRISEEC